MGLRLGCPGRGELDRDDQGREAEFTAPYATGKIRRNRPLALDEFVFLRDATKVTPKITLPAPSTMHFFRCTDFAAPSAYSDIVAFFGDLAAAFAQEIAELAAAGCRYVQLDEVAIALLCDPGIRARFAAAAARAAGASCPEPTMVTSTGAPASRPRAAPMTGVPCSGV